MSYLDNRVAFGATTQIPRHSPLLMHMGESSFP